ncbi:MAG: clan AA aspartic protease [Bacteroidetes bacterium]|nr:clan AA aspartic protease [Bacteroidota bacterium]
MIIKIPIIFQRIDNQGWHLFVTANLNGFELNLLIDTGASMSVFDKNRIFKYVSDVKLEQNEQLSTGLGTNTMESESLVLEELSVGELKIKNYQIVIIDMSHVNESYEKLGLKNLDGVLGSDILMKYKATINYKTKTLILRIRNG